MFKNDIFHSLLRSFYFFFFFLGVYLVLKFSPSMFPTIVADTDSYLDNESSRKSIYPLIIFLCKKVNFDVLELQKIFLAFSLIILYESMKQIKINKIFRFLFLVLILTNIYYTSFSKVILTEAFFFGSINILISLIIFYRTDNLFIILLIGLLIGFIASIKSIGIVIAIIFLVSLAVVIKNKNYLNLSILFSSVIFFPLIEYYYFFSKNSVRTSVLPTAIIGKSFMISGLNEFKIEKYPSEFSELFSKSKKEFETVQKFLRNINNPFLKADLSSDYETVAQYQLFKEDLAKLKKVLNKNEKEISQIIMKKLIQNNFLELVNLSLINYLGLWSTGSKYIFLEKYLDSEQIEVPLQKELKMSSGEIMNIKDNILIVVLFFFTVLFLIFFCISIFICIKMNQLFFKKNFFLVLFTFSSQMYLFLVGITNVATPRYLMAVYPMILIVIFLSISLIKDLKK